MTRRCAIIIAVTLVLALACMASALVFWFTRDFQASAMAAIFSCVFMSVAIYLEVYSHRG